MAIVKNPDGTVTVGEIPVKADKPTEKPADKKPEKKPVKK